MKLTKFLSERKTTIHSVLLAIQVFSPILMFVGIKLSWLPLVYIGLAAIILSNLTATLTK